MGGRGSKSGINSGALNKNAKEQVIETYYRKNSRYGSHYGQEVLGAKEEKNGEITLSTESARFKEKYSNANTQGVEFRIKNGVSKSFNSGETNSYGINWDKVKSVSGDTYNIRDFIKGKGFSWDRNNKKWVKK